MSSIATGIALALEKNTIFFLENLNIKYNVINPISGYITKIMEIRVSKK